jgi:hypothetical protein
LGATVPRVETGAIVDVVTRPTRAEEAPVFGVSTGIGRRLTVEENPLFTTVTLRRSERPALPAASYAIA